VLKDRYETRAIGYDRRAEVLGEEVLDLQRKVTSEEWKALSGIDIAALQREGWRSKSGE